MGARVAVVESLPESHRLSKRLTQWTNRRNLFRIGSSQRQSQPEDADSQYGSSAGTVRGLCVSAYKADNHLRLTPAQGISAFFAANETDLGRPSSPGPRWRGLIGPALYMTAVEAAPPSEGKREHGERCGREARRVMRFSAEQRAKNDLPPWQPLGDALANPGPALARLIESAQLEALEHGCKGARRTAVAWLSAHGSHALGSDAKSAQTTTAHGYKGLTVAGRRSIRDASSLLAEYQGSLAFGTVTLPDDVAENITREQLATFQSRWLFYARRMLQMRGLEPLLVLVAEIHPNRRSLSGGPVIHWHWCARVSHVPFGKWAAKIRDWDRVTAQAHASAFGRARGNTHGLWTEAARIAPGRYLSKYLSKSRSDCQALIGTEWERAIPRQWWTWTGEMRALVKACRVRPPSAFLRWCCRWSRELADLGEVISEPIQIGEDGPVVGRWFCWRDEDALDRAIETWIAEELALRDWIEQEQEHHRSPADLGAASSRPAQWPHPDAPDASGPPRQN